MTRPTMRFMTVPACDVPAVCLGDHVHVVVATGPVVDFATYLGPKSCREAVVFTMDPDDPAVVGVVLSSGEPCVTPSNDCRFDGVSLPKIESGPSGRAVGTWHLPWMCG
jgi:hypothetical protein